MHLLLTGGAGFIGSAMIRYFLRTYRDGRVTVLDSLTYAANVDNLAPVLATPPHRFIQGDIGDPYIVDSVVTECDVVVNMAAESHVDRSVLDPAPFLRTNVLGVATLLESVTRHKKRMVHVSTDEVYGSIDGDRWATENAPMMPSSPYAVSKTGGESLCRSFFAAHATDVVITRGCNTIGPRQHPEKFVPLLISNALRGEPLPIYGDGQYVRDWMDVDDHVEAIDMVLRAGAPGETYNIGAGNLTTNLEIARGVVDRLAGVRPSFVHVPDRCPHDRRYAMDTAKIRRELGWRRKYRLEDALTRTVTWYLANEARWRAIREDDLEFRRYYRAHYGWRFAAASPETADAIA